MLCGYKPVNKFNIVGSAPNHTVANKESHNLVNIHLDQTLPLIEDKELRQGSIFFQLTHELSHASVCDIGLIDMVHYNLLRGKFVDEYSDEEFEHMAKTLIENARIDSNLTQNDNVRRAFFLNNMSEIKWLDRKFRFIKNSKTKPVMDYDLFRQSIEILHTASVANYLKSEKISQGFEKQVATDMTGIFHNGLKGVIKDTELKELLQEAYDFTSAMCIEKDNSLQDDIKDTLRSIWDSRVDL